MSDRNGEKPRLQNGWEVINPDEDDTDYLVERFAVPGGWLYRVVEQSAAFVPETRPDFRPAEKAGGVDALYDEIAAMQDGAPEVLTGYTTDWVLADAVGVRRVPELPEGWSLSSGGISAVGRGVVVSVEPDGLEVGTIGAHGGDGRVVPIAVVRALLARLDGGGA